MKKVIVAYSAGITSLILLFTIGMPAQLAAQRSVYLDIMYADTTTNPVIVVCKSPYSVVLKPFDSGEVMTKEDKEQEEVFETRIGNATVLKISDSLVAFSVSFNSLGEKRSVRVGDLVKISVNDTLFHPRDFIGHLLALQLKLNDQYREPFFSDIALANSYYKDPAAAEKWLLDTLYTDLKDFYEGYKDNLTSETFTAPFPKGRYKGKNVRQVFEQLTRQEIKEFLWFMISFPGKYVGVPYKFNETFATWLINNSPFGGYEVLMHFEEARGDSVKLAAKLKSIEGMLTEDGLSQNVAISVNNNGYWEKDYDWVDRQYEAAIWYSRLSGDRGGEGLTYLFRGEKAQNSDQYDEALRYCRLSESVYLNPPEHDRLLDVYFKQSFLYYSSYRYDSSFVMLAKVKKLLALKDLKITDYSLNEATGKYHDYMAYTYYKTGRFKEAELYIDSSLFFVKGMEDKKSLTTIAYNYNLKGGIYKGQSLFDKSLDAYEQSASYYKKAGDMKTAASMKVDVGIVLFKQGKYRESNELLFKIMDLYESDNDYNNIGLCYSQIGQNYWNLNLYDSAIACHNKAIGLRKQAANRSGEAFSWEQLGTLYQRAGFKNKALEALDTAARLYEDLGSKTELAEVLLEAGKVYKNDKENDKAEQYYKRASNALAALGNKSSYADALFELGLLTMGDKPYEAEVYMDSCRILCLETGKQSDAAYSMMNLGTLLKSRGKIAEGKKMYLQARDIVVALNEPHAIAHYYRSLGRDAEWELNLDSSNRCYERAMVIFDSTDKSTALQMASSIASNYQAMGKYEEAEKRIDRVMEQALAGGLLLELAGAYQSKAWMLLQQGQTEKGLSLADSASKYYEVSGNSNSLASIYALRGDFNRKLFNFSEAFKWYSRSDSIYARSKNPWMHSTGMINFIVLYYYQGDYQKSLDYTHKALALRPFLLEDQTYLDLQGSLAEIYYYLGKPDSAKYFINKYLPVARKQKLIRSENWLALMMGRLLVDEKKYKEAIPYLVISTESEAAKNDLSNYQQALAFLGMAYSGTQQKDSAQLYFKLAEKTAKTFELPSFSWEALYLAGLDAYNNSDFVKAIPLFKDAVALVNKQANNLYGGEEASKLFKKQPAKADLYFKLMSALTKTGQKEEAWQYATLSQAAAVSDLAGGLSAATDDKEKQKALQEAQAKFQQIQSVGQALQESKKDSLGRAGQIAVLQKKQAIAEEEYLFYIKTLKKNYPELNTFFANQGDPGQFRNLHTNLPEDMAMIMYIVNDKELMIFWATKANTGIVTGTIPDNFFQTTEAWIAALKNPERPAGAGPLVLRTKIGKVPGPSHPIVEVKSGAQQLFNLLIEPILPQIKDKKAWCIIPNGKLTHLPFHALGTNNAAGKFEYIAATKNIFYTNQPSELFIPWDRRNKESFAAFGNPDNTLESAGVEAKQIAKVYKTANVYTEEGATIDRATQSLSNLQYVHFATHGVLIYPEFDSSYLVFAPGADQPNGGKLTLHEIGMLNIKGCDLVTLSACETAVSAEIAKGWYVSPANAFLINRVRSVIASLWEVDDVSTSLLMQQFYKYLQTMPKAEALRKAMADVSAKPEFEHPFYWAAFVLYGDYK